MSSIFNSLKNGRPLEEVTEEMMTMDPQKRVKLLANLGKKLNGQNILKNHTTDTKNERNFKQSIKLAKVLYDNFEGNIEKTARTYFKVRNPPTTHSFTNRLLGLNTPKAISPRPPNKPPTNNQRAAMTRREIAKAHKNAGKTKKVKKPIKKVSIREPPAF